MRALFIFSMIICVTLLGCQSSSPEEAETPSTAENALEAAEEVAEDVDGHNDEAELAEDMQPDETRHFGAPFTIEGEAITLGELLARAESSENYATEEEILVSAEIHQVCQNKGCWFTLSTDEVDIPVRVRMKDYGFFVARNTTGAPVTVQGTFEKTTISQELAQHFADDVAKETGDDPEVIDGPQENYEFTATGIEITLPAG